MKKVHFSITILKHELGLNLQEPLDNSGPVGVSGSSVEVPSGADAGVEAWGQRAMPQGLKGVDRNPTYFLYKTGCYFILHRTVEFKIQTGWARISGVVSSSESSSLISNWSSCGLWAVQVASDSISSMHTIKLHMLSRVGILYLLHDVILNISHGIRHHMLVPLFKSTTRPTLRHVSALISTGALGQSVFQLNFSLCVIQWPNKKLEVCINHSVGTEPCFFSPHASL